MRFYMSLRDSTCGIVAIYNFTRFIFHLVIARGVSLVAIYNLKSCFKDFIAVINLALHYRLPRLRTKSRNDNKPPIASLRGANEMSNEAIYNLAKSKFCNGIFKIIPHYRLPQPLTRLRNDKRAKSTYRFAQCGQTATQCAPRITSDSRNDNKPPIASLRGANEMSNEAIHNIAKSKFCNGIFKIIPHYRLPRLRTKSRNDCDSRIINMLDDRLPQPLTRLRNDKAVKSAYRFVQCGQTATQCAPRITSDSRNDK